MKNLIKYLEFGLKSTSLILILAFFCHNKSFGQCTGCGINISTNVAPVWTANNQKICITANSYSSLGNTLDNAACCSFTNKSLCIASNVNWSGTGFTQGQSTTTIDLYGTSSYAFTGYSGLNSGVILNVKSGGTYTGSITFASGGIVNVDGNFNPSAGNLNNGGGTLNISSLGSATIPSGTVGITINNSGNMLFPNAVSIVSVTPQSNFGGNVVFNNTVSFGNGTTPVIISGNITVNGNFNINGYTTMLPGASLTVNGNMTVGSNTTLAGTVLVTGDFLNNAPVIQQSGTTSINGNATINNTYGGGGAGGCGYFCPTGTFTNNSTISAGSGLSLCKAPTSGASAGAGVGVFNTGSTSQPTNFTVAASTSSGYNGTFSISTNTGTNGYIVVRRPSGQPTAPTSFTNYVAGSVVSGNTIVVAVLSPRTVSNFIDIQPSTCGTQYFYAAYAYQNSTTTGTACGSLFYINTLSPATANFTPAALGTTNSITGSASVCSNGSSNYSTATVSGATGYMWSYSGSGVTVASTTTSAILTFNSTATSGILTVRGFSACATSAGSTLTLTLTSAPTILTQPVSSTICGGTNSSFTVSASGSSLAYAWQQSTNSGATWSNLSNGGVYSGVSTQTLTLTGLSSVYSGYRFRSIVSNSCAPASTSSGASLTLNTIGQWLGTINSDWSNASNWCGQPTLTTDNASINSSASIMPIITSSSVNIGGLTIGTSASVTLQGSNTMTLSGNFINNGTFTPNTGKVNFSGTSAQVISGSGINLFYDIGINNTTSVTLRNTISVSGTMTMGVNAKYHSSTFGFTTVFLSTTSGTARLASLPATYTFTGNITMQRFIPAKPTLRLMSSAVAGATISQWKNSIPITGIGGVSNGFDAASSNINTVWYFNEALNAPTTYRYVGAPNTSMGLNIGAGYRVFVRGNRNSVNLFGAYTVTSVVMSVTNPPNTGTINLPVTYTNYNAPFRDGTNLVGNPYPCEINWDAAGWTKTNIDNALYMWDPNLGTNGQYYYYVGGVASPSRTNPGIIASSQGFFVKANAASPVLRLTEAVKTIAGHTGNFRTSNSGPSDVIRLQLKDTTSNFDEAVVRFVDGATSAFDKDYDAYKLNNSSLNIFSNPVTGTDLSINALGTDVTNVTVPLSVFSTKIGRYSIQASGLDNFTDETSVYLKDSYLNTFSEMTNDSKYNFNITSDTKSSGTNRFSLVVYRTMITTGTDLVNNNYSPTLKLFPNPNNGTGLTLEMYNFKEASVELVVKDVSGRMLITKNLQTENLPYFQTELSDFGLLSNGVYFVTINTSKTHYTEKVILVK